ncbi:MAG: hypothetical protein P4L98_09245, partial [Ancalomicrobiaceae bacterium]|nr:hypothetical protein [Ancalomicrobiaceae bacterium]
AQEAMQVKCPEDAVPLPAELSGWTTQLPIVAATQPGQIGSAEVKVGQAVKASMQMTPGVTYAARPANPGGTVSSGGIFKLSIPETGTYRVAVGTHSWIDIVDSGKLVESVNHGGGPACSGIKKMVDYPLNAGTYVLQLSAGDEMTAGILVVKLP